jgi:DNA invertase Pin-like site-specific DNA recombinase
MQLDGYVRLSRIAGRGGDSFISPEVQEREIRTWAKLRGVEIAEIHRDLDQSGGVLARPGLDALLERVRTGKTGGVVASPGTRRSSSMASHPNILMRFAGWLVPDQAVGGGAGVSP